MPHQIVGRLLIRYGHSPLNRFYIHEVLIISLPVSLLWVGLLPSYTLSIAQILGFENIIREIITRSRGPYTVICYWMGVETITAGVLYQH